MEEVYSPSVSGRSAGRSSAEGRRRLKSGLEPQIEVSPSGSSSKLLSVRGKGSKKNRMQSLYNKRSSSVKSTANGYTARSGQDSLTVMRSRGYSIHRSPSGVEMTINPPTFFGDEEEFHYRPSTSGSGQESSHKSRHSTCSVSGKDQEEKLLQLNLENVELQAQLQELKMVLQREREENEKHVEELQMQFEEERQGMLAQHKEELEMKTERHEIDTAILKATHHEQIKELQEQYEKQIADLRVEIEKSKELHEHAMAELEKQHQHNISQQKLKMKKEHKEEIEMLETMRQRDSSEQIAQLKREMGLSHEEELLAIKEQHRRETEKMLQQFSGMGKVEEELAKSKKHVRKLEKQSSKYKADMYAAHTKQHKAEAELLQIRTELEKFKSDFQNRVRESQARTRDRLDQLLLENTQLRRKLLLKTQEFSDYRSAVESTNAKVIRSYKEKVHVMIKARQKANLSVAMGIAEEKEEEVEPEAARPRPSSAPVTRRESSKARRHAKSSDHVVSAQQSNAGSLVSLRPSSCLAHLKLTN